jgi:hypothetical protein
MPQKPQTAPLPLSGVPQQAQIPVQAPAAAIPAPQPPAAPQVQLQQQPFDQEAAQNVAIAREQALRGQAQEQYPDQSSASILATLSGIAGNIAGTLTGKGDVGTQAVQYGGQLREEAGQKQRQFMTRVLEAEQKYKVEQKEMTDLRNKQLRADSMVSLINRLPDAELKTALFSQLAAGDVDGAQSALHQAQEMQRQRELDAFNRKLKIEQSEMATDRLDMAKRRAELDEKIKEINYAQKVYNYSTMPEKEQRKIVEKETKEYNSTTQKLKGPVSDFVSIMQMIGDPESPEAKDRLNRIMGATGVARGAYLGTPEDKKLFQAIQHLYATVKTEDFGASFTADEQRIFKAAAGVGIGSGLLGNVGRNADNVIAGLQDMQKIFETKLDAAGANKHPRTLEGFEKGGNYLTLRAFTSAMQDARAIGGKNLDSTPAGVDPNVWSQLNRSQRTEFYKQVGGANAQ